MKLLTVAVTLLAAIEATPFLKYQNDPAVWPIKSESKTPATAIIHKENSDWSIYSHASFPGYSVRVRNKESKLCDSSVKQKVGYLDAEGKHFFFWFFESRANPQDDPLILWLNGGPGCSSLTGLLMELGPCRVNPKGNGTTFNPYSWNTNANVIFLDQPVEVGFSYADDKKFPTNSVDAAKDVYVFLQIFLNKWSEFADNDFHVTGESYAGHYIPAIGKEISDANKRHKQNAFIIPIKLTSLAIGNGLTDPYNQYGSYPDMACDEKYGPFLEEEQCDKMRKQFPSCQRLIGSCYDKGSVFSCVPSAMYCNNVMISPFQKTGRNVYDVRKTCDVSKNPLCYEIANDIEAYLNDPAIQTELGVDRKYKGCDMNINLKFLLAGDWMKPYVRDLPPLLQEGVRVLIYAGDADYICNWKGNKKWVHELEWKYKKNFNSANDTAWVSEITGRPLGELKSYKNFAFLRVFEAGHMVPYDQPEHANEFINWWLKKQ